MILQGGQSKEVSRNLKVSNNFVITKVMGLILLQHVDTVEGFSLKHL